MIMMRIMLHVFDMVLVKCVFVSFDMLWGGTGSDEDWYNCQWLVYHQYVNWHGSGAFIVSIQVTKWGSIHVMHICEGDRNSSTRCWEASLSACRQSHSSRESVTSLTLWTQHAWDFAANAYLGVAKGGLLVPPYAILTNSLLPSRCVRYTACATHRFADYFGRLASQRGHKP